jgi:hypothetical protein
MRERINSTKINLETLTEPEARTLHTFLGEKCLQAQEEWLKLDELVERRFPQEPEVV